MVRRQLPVRPHLGHLRKQAKDLAKAFRTEDPGRRISLAFAQFTLARDYGFDSWPKLKLFVEASTQTFDEKLARFIAAACSDRLYQAKQLLEIEPRLARHNLVTAVIVGDVEHATTLLAENPELAHTPTGPYASEPLGYLAFSRFHRDGAAQADAMRKIARHLLELGANVDGTYLFPGAGLGEDPHVSILYGAIANSNHQELASILLEAGANPNDNESLYHAAELPKVDALRLLLTHGAKVAGTNALKRKLDFDELDGLKLLLDHGGDPNDGALHHAIRRGRNAGTIAMLLDHGAGIAARDTDGLTPYQVALRHGNSGVLAVLEARGAEKSASPAELFLAACARADRAAAEQIKQTCPRLLQDLSANDLRLMTEFAQRDQVDAIRTLLDCGIDIEAKGDWGGTALHHAAWHGAVATVELLIRRGAALESTNAYGGTVLGAAIHGSANCRNPLSDYAQVVESLLEAGAKVQPHLHGMGSESADEMLKAFAE